MILLQLLEGLVRLLWFKYKKLFLIILSGPLLIVFMVAVVTPIFLRHVAYSVPAERQVKPAYKAGSFKIKYTGISGYEISNGQTTVLTDPVITRPTFSTLLSGPVEIDEALVKKTFPRADYILINHSHFDHAIDAAIIAEHTGATIVGSENTLNLARARGIPEARLIQTRDGLVVTLGSFKVTMVKGQHAPIGPIENPMSGYLKPEKKKRWFWQYYLDETYIFHLQGPRRSVWFHPTVRYYPGEYKNLRADVLIHGVTGGYKFKRSEIREVLETVMPRVVIPSHYDNFFQPVSKGLALLPSTQLHSFNKLLSETNFKAENFVLDYNEAFYLK